MRTRYSSGLGRAAVAMAAVAAGLLVAASPAGAVGSAPGSPAPSPSVSPTVRVTTDPTPSGSVTPSGGTVRIRVRPTAVRAGRSVVISGTVPTTGERSSPAGEDPILTSAPAFFPPDGFGPVAARTPSGDFRVHYTVPAGTPAGTYAIGLRCGGGNLGVHTTLRVTAPARRLPGTPPRSEPGTPPGVEPGGQAGGTQTGDTTGAAGGVAAGWLVAGFAAGAAVAALGVLAWRRGRS